MRISTLVLTVSLTAGLAVAAAAQTQPKTGKTAELTCVDAAGFVTATVFGFAIEQQTATPVGTQSTGSGAGAGKVASLGEASVDLARTAFVSFAGDADSGLVFSQCSLTGISSGIRADFTDVHLDDVKLLDGSAKTDQQAQATAGPIVEVAFSYLSSRFTTASQSTGTVPTQPLGGWNRVTNTNPTTGGAGS